MSATDTFAAMSAAGLALEAARDRFKAALISRPGDAEAVSIVTRADLDLVIVYVNAPTRTVEVRTDGHGVVHRVSPAGKLSPTTRGARILAAVQERVGLARDLLDAAHAVDAARYAHTVATTWAIVGPDGETVERHASEHGATLARDARHPFATIIAPEVTR